jgi:hypothetical protein
LSKEGKAWDRLAATRSGAQSGDALRCASRLNAIPNPLWLGRSLAFLKFPPGQTDSPGPVVGFRERFVRRDTVMPIPCPEPATLCRFLLGLIPVAETPPLEEHLASCPHCVQVLQELAVEDALTTAARASATLPIIAPETLEMLILRYSLLQTPSPSQDTTSAQETAQEVCACLIPPQSPDELGRLGQYRVLEVIGVGGMGVVFRAVDETLGRQVALKVIRPTLAASPQARKRFLAEARAAAALTHDHIVTIYQSGEDGAVPYLAMQLLAGETLETRLDREPILPLPEVLRIGREVASALDFAHRHGFIHRDIKPANIWLEAGTGRVKILDFGVVRLGADSTHRTAQGVAIGTPAYMAPEQAGGEPIDARADLYSLGCVLYRLATGDLPFRGKDILALLRNMAVGRPVPPERFNPTLPKSLSRLIQRLLARDRNDRPASASEVIAALDGTAPEPGPSRRRWWLAAALVAGLAGLAGLFLGGVWLFHQGHGEPTRRIDPRANGELLFQDDFHANKPSAVPLFDNSITWEHAGGAGRLTGTAEGIQPVLYPAVAAQDFFAEVECRLMTPRSHHGYGLLFRSSEPRNATLADYYAVIVDPAGPSVALVLWTRGTWTVLKKETVHPRRTAVGVPHLLRIEAVGSEFRIFVDGMLSCHVEDATLPRAGIFGLHVYDPDDPAPNTVEFRHFRVWSPGG